MNWVVPSFYDLHLKTRVVVKQTLGELGAREEKREGEWDIEILKDRPLRHSEIFGRSEQQLNDIERKKELS